MKNKGLDKDSVIAAQMNQGKELSWNIPSEFPDLTGYKQIAIDLETCDPNLTTLGPGWVRKDGYIVGIAVAAGDWEGYYPIRHENGHNMDARIALKWLKKQMATPHIDKIMHNATYDQAIHRWTSVDVQRFIKSSDNIEVLNRSFRLPRSIWELSMRISRKIPGRLEKEFFPKQVEGRVTTVGSLWQLPLDSGSWTIMARTNSFVNDIAEHLEESGYFYSRKGKWSISEKKLNAMSVWKDITMGKGVYVGRVKQMYEVVPKTGEDAVVKRGSMKLLEAAGSEELLTYDTLVKEFGLLASITTSELDIVKLSEQEKIYIRSIQRRGESIYQQPRIKLSTIHAMKGGEDTNVAVYLGSTRNCVESKHPEDEHRIFYVAITRAKENLYLIESDKSYRYDI